MSNDTIKATVPVSWIDQRPDLVQMQNWVDPKLTGTAVIGQINTETRYFPHTPPIAEYPTMEIRPYTDKPVDTSWVADAQKTKHAYTFLETAVKEMKDRAAQRDTQNAADPAKSGERSMAATIKAFNALTGHTLSEAEGWEFMILLKLVRGRQGDFRADDYVDAAAYSGLLGECASKTRK